MKREDFTLLSEKIPSNSGVYFFLDAHKKPLYIGKATTLRDRVKSYFAKDIDIIRSPLIAKMIEEAVSIDFKETASVLEAMLLEADLIRTFKPEYNTKEKDDKSYNCVVLTKETFPKVLIVRKKDLESGAFTEPVKYIYGPFPHPGELREALKIIRKIFPYRDEKCEPGQGKPCFNRQIGLCPGVCTGEVSEKEYAITIKRLNLFFKGSVGKLLSELRQDMERFAEKEAFEEANEVKRKLFAIEHIQDIALLKRDKQPVSDTAVRIEAYDIAHISGSDRVGVMTVVMLGEAYKAAYRKFKLQTDKNDDVGGLAEILKRRLTHPEWGTPGIIVVDGSIAQKRVAERILGELNMQIPVIAVVKNEKHKAEKLLGDMNLIAKHREEILLANSEAHRFAITYHRKRRGNMLQ